MKKTALIKIFTLLSSVGLVTIFLLYRTGYFEDEKRNPGKELAQTAHSNLYLALPRYSKSSAEFILPFTASSKSAFAFSNSDC